LRVLHDIDAHPGLYDTPIVRGIIASKWHAFAKEHLQRESIKFVVGFLLFLVYQVGHPGCRAMPGDAQGGWGKGWAAQGRQEQQRQSQLTAPSGC
jgi:hypothetical protein